MAIAITLREYLDQTGIHYDVLKHSYAETASEIAAVAHIPGNQMAKGVLLEDEQGYLMAVVPSTHRIHIGKLHKLLHRNLGLATEREVAMLFDDCDIGAMPPCGQAYGIDVIIDECLNENADIYFEAGDHMDMIHLSGSDFRALMTTAQYGNFSKHI